MRTLIRVLLSFVVAFVILSAAPADAAHKHRHHKKHHHAKVRVHNQRQATKAVAPKPATVDPRAPLSAYPVLPNIGPCLMYLPHYFETEDKVYLICG